MPTPVHSDGEPCWIDLMTSDTGNATGFYGELFGWTFETGDQEKYGGYITALKNGKPVAGIMQKQEGQAGFPDVWSTYLRSDDARATVNSAVEHGGQVYVEPMDVPEQGTMAMIGDATGAAVGVWQPGAMKGYGIAAEAGAPAWHELQARDYAAGVRFYQDVFGWNTDVMSDTPGFRYTTLGTGDTAKAGIMDASGYLPAEVPSHWRVYFAVADTDAAVEKAVAMGGRVIDAPEDSPFGRLATLSDPTGATFKVVAGTTPGPQDGP